MVHRLLETTEITIHDGPEHGSHPLLASLQAKKAFSHVRPLVNTDPERDPFFIAYDRYRFEIVELPLSRGRQSGLRR